MSSLKTFQIIAWVAVVIVGGFLVGLRGFLPKAPQPPQSAVDLSAIGGPFELTTPRGQTFTNADVAGRPYLVFFGFTSCPDICPTTLAELTSLMEELGADANRFTPLFITVDPERDSQQLLAEYMSAFDRRIIALRGTPEQTDNAVRAFQAYYRKVPMAGGDYTMDHTAGVLLMRADGRFMGTMDMHEPRDVRIAKLRRLVGTAA